MKFDEDLARVHAYLCADGYVIRNHIEQKHKYYRIGLRNTNLLLLKDFQERSKRVWGKEPRLTEGQRCEVYSKEIYMVLNQNFGSFYSREWRMPKLSKNLERTWLGAYFDCEGWVSVEKHKSRLIGADCVNLYGLGQIKRALGRNGIKAQIKKHKEVFRLYIYGRGNLHKFKCKIGFYHPQKACKLQEALDDYVVYDWKFPRGSKKMKDFVKTIMREKAKIKQSNGTVSVISKKKTNLIVLKKELKTLFFIESKINKNFNGIGTRYYQLNIYKRGMAKKAMEMGLLKVSGA